MGQLSLINVIPFPAHKEFFLTTSLTTVQPGVFTGKELFTLAGKGG
jgi:hypothetical protein